MMSANSRKKILVFVDWFEPAFKGGGPIRSCVNFAYHMKNDYDIFVFTGDRDLGDSQPLPGIKENEWVTLQPGVQVFYASPGFLKWKNLRQQMTLVNADFIYLNHLFSPWYVIVPLLIWWRNFRDRSVMVLCPRGALFNSAIRFRNTYLKKITLIRALKTVNLHKLIRFHATNESEKQAILQYFPGSGVLIANNLPAGKLAPFSTIIKQHRVLDLIIISRVVDIKNHLFLLKALSKITGRDIKLTIVGPREDPDYWSVCEKEISRMPSNIMVNYLGSMENDGLINLIQHHHLFVLPTMGENFGHSIFESFLAGRPVLISDQTPWRGLKDLGIGWDLPLEEDLFVSAIRDAADWDQATFNRMATNAWTFAGDFLKQPSLKKDYLELFA